MVQGIGTTSSDFAFRNPVRNGLTLDLRLDAAQTDDLGPVRQLLNRHTASSNHTSSSAIEARVQEVAFQTNSTTAAVKLPPLSVLFATTTGVSRVDLSQNSDAHFLPDLEPLPSNFIPETAISRFETPALSNLEPSKFLKTFENLCAAHAPSWIPCESIRSLAERSFTWIGETAWELAQSFNEGFAPAAIGAGTEPGNAEPLGQGPAASGGVAAAIDAAERGSTDTAETAKKAVLGLFLLLALTSSKRAYITAPSEPIFLREQPNTSQKV